MDNETPEKKGDLLISNLCQRGTDSIKKMCVMNTDAYSHQKKSLEKCLWMDEKEKEKKYLYYCL